MVKAKIKPVSRITNASALARELGVTREHLWRVVTGRRESRRLTVELRERGLTFEPATLRARHSLRSARLLPHGSQAPSRGGYALKRQGKGGK